MFICNYDVWRTLFLSLSSHWCLSALMSSIVNHYGYSIRMHWRGYDWSIDPMFYSPSIYLHSGAVTSTEKILKKSVSPQRFSELTPWATRDVCWWLNDSLLHCPVGWYDSTFTDVLPDFMCWHQGCEFGDVGVGYISLYRGCANICVGLHTPTFLGNCRWLCTCSVCCRLVIHTLSHFVTLSWLSSPSALVEPCSGLVVKTLDVTQLQKQSWWLFWKTQMLVLPYHIISKEDAYHSVGV